MKGLRKLFKIERGRNTLNRVGTAQEKPEKRDFFEKNQGKPGKLREFSDHLYNLRENSGSFILPNISDQISGALNGESTGFIIQGLRV